MIEFHGKSQSVGAWARELGMPRATLVARLRRGWTIERALTTPVQKKSPGVNQIVEFGGVRQSIKEHAADYGISATLILTRLKYGWTLERAITEPVRLPKVLAYKGKCQSVKDWAHELGLQQNLIYGRLRAGYSDKTALTKPAPKSEKLIEFNGKRQSISAWARELGFRGSILYARFNRGWSVEEALTIPPGGDRQLSEARGDRPGEANERNAKFCYDKGQKPCP